MNRSASATIPVSWPALALILLWTGGSFSGADRTVRGLSDLSLEVAAVSVVRTLVLAIGAIEGSASVELSEVPPPFVLPDGKIVVPLASEGKIRVFDRDGGMQASYGGSGEGPGEFRYLTNAWARGDTIEAFDSEVSRITRFAPDGTVETIKLDISRLSRVPHSAVPGAFGQGWVLMGVTGFDRSGRDEVSVFHFLRDGQFQGVITRVGGILRDPRGIGPVPLSPSAYLEIKGDELFVGETLTPRIRTFDPAGLDGTAVSWTPGPVSPGKAIREVTRIAVDRAEPANRQRLRDRLSETPKPDVVPVFSSFLLDESGFIWIRPYEVARDAAVLGGALYLERPAGGEWRVFHSNGEEVGSIAIPEGFAPSQVTSAEVLGVWKDEFDVEYVRIHRVHRR